MNQNVATSERLLTHDVCVHHKSRIGKELYIVLTAFLPIYNNIAKYGLAKKLLLVRSGRMVEVKNIHTIAFTELMGQKIIRLRGVSTFLGIVE